MSASFAQPAQPESTQPWWSGDAQGLSAAHWYGCEICNMVARLQELAGSDSPEVGRNARVELARATEACVMAVIHLKHEA